MSTYKLTYFNGMGRAEVTRLLFAMGDTEYDDVRVAREQWMELKPNTPFGQLPILEVDGEVICQGKAIELFVAKRLGLAGKTDIQEARCHMIDDCVEDTLKTFFKTFSETEAEKKKEARENYCQNDLPVSLKKFEGMLEKRQTEFFNGDQITLADLIVFQMLTGLPVYDYIKFDLSQYPKVNNVVEKVRSNSKIAAWIEKRPKTPF